MISSFSAFVSIVLTIIDKYTKAKEEYNRTLEEVVILEFVEKTVQRIKFSHET